MPYVTCGRDDAALPCSLINNGNSVLTWHLHPQSWSGSRLSASLGSGCQWVALRSHDPNIRQQCWREGLELGWEPACTRASQSPDSSLQPHYVKLRPFRSVV